MASAVEEKTEMAKVEMVLDQCCRTLISTDHSLPLEIAAEVVQAVI